MRTKRKMVFGTEGATYTAPGMNSDLSRARQSGLLGIVTSDDSGNLASDNGRVTAKWPASSLKPQCPWRSSIPFSPTTSALA